MSCKTSKELCYKYQVNTFRVDKGYDTLLLTSTQLVSCKEYLLEFKNLINVENPNTNDTASKTSVWFETKGLYLMSNKNKTYFDFDKFSLDGVMKQQGPLNSKPSGFKFSPTGESASSDLYYGPVKDTSINNIPCYYTQVFSKYDDSTITKLILIKKDNFNSLYRVNGVEFTNKQYCIIGYSVYTAGEIEGVFQEIASLRLLTKEEINICRALIKKSKQ